MNITTRRIQSIVANVYVAFFGSLASIVALIWFTIDKIKPWSLLWVVLVPGTVLCLSGIAIYSVRVRQENIQFRNLAKILHRVNHAYRDTLFAVFKNFSTEINPSDYESYLKQSERKTIKSTCERVAKVYNAFTHAQCTVSVKLIGRREGRTFCETYERSEENCERDAGESRLFDVGTGANTAFDRALMYAQGTVSHFHSWDLTKEKDYHNQRDHWADFYKNVIVVPIRAVNSTKIGTKDGTDDIGFLCVDTLSANRLNETWHVELLAAFADQMYNFISLMRGRYSLSRAGTVLTEPLPKVSC